MLDDKVKKDVTKILSNMKNFVTIKFFSQGMECGHCKDAHELLNDLMTTTDKIKLEVYDFVKDAEEVKKYKIAEIPAMVVMNDKVDRIRFYGLPAGYEFSSLLNALLLTSTDVVKLTKETKAFLDDLTKLVHLKVFVTPTCPYCPQAVILAHQMAYYSKYVHGTMIELVEFPHLAVKYNVQGVPRTVVNEKWFQDGAAPEQILVDKIKQALANVAEKPAVKPSAKSGEKKADKPVAKKATKPVEKAPAKQVEKPAAKAEKPKEKPAKKPVVKKEAKAKKK
jgi:glutaredoxin-like protein